MKDRTTNISHWKRQSMRKIKFSLLVLALTFLLTGCNDILNGFEAILALFYIGLKWFLIVVVVILVISVIGAIFNRK
nr:hypothetical protein [uncultured Draconibacterium sp.]